MMSLAFSGLALVATVLIMLARTNIRRWLGYVNVVDISFTLFMIVLFHGTFSGVVSAAFAGIWMSLILQLLRKRLGYQRIAFTRVRWWKGALRMRWVDYPPTPFNWKSAFTR